MRRTRGGRSRIRSTRCWGTEHGGRGWLWRALGWIPLIAVTGRLMLEARTILHLDLDAFFCAVEELHNPFLRGKAFAVGGQPEERGVVASCSYAARKVGVRSAMPMGRAMRLCPDLIVVSARFSDYGAMSRQVMARVRAVTPLVEQISIDEAWLDVTSRGDDGETIARALQSQIRTELGLPCSLGVASNKLVAKIANNMGKAAVLHGGGRDSGPPNAINVVPRGGEEAFLAPLPVSELWGVGPATAKRLAEFGVHTIGQLAQQSQAELTRHFGKTGAVLWQHAHGRDDSPIVTEHERKSVSQETTFVRDVDREDVLKQTLFGQAREVAVTLRWNETVGQTVRLKLRWADFTTITRQMQVPAATADAQMIYETALLLFEKAWDGRPIRLIGVGVAGLQAADSQPTLFDVQDDRQERLEATLREVRARYGDSAVRTARELDRKRREQGEDAPVDNPRVDKSSG